MESCHIHTHYTHNQFSCERNSQGGNTYLRIPLIDGLTGVWGGANGRPSPPRSINDMASQFGYHEAENRECCAPATLSPVGLSCPIRSRCCCGRGSRTWRSPTAGDTEPVENIIGLDWNVVVYTSSTDSLEVRSVNGASPPRQRRVLLSRSWGLAVVENVCPLLDAFGEIVVVEGSVTVNKRKMVSLQSSGMAGIISAVTHSVPCQICIFGLAPV